MNHDNMLCINTFMHVITELYVSLLFVLLINYMHAICMSGATEGEERFSEN